MQYRHVILSASIVLATGCPSDPTPSELDPGDTAAAGGLAPAPAPHEPTTTSTAPATSCPAPVVCPAAKPAPAPTCPAPAACPAATECPAPAECPVCTDPYPAMPTTYGASDAWPLPTDHPHGLTAFCHVTLPTTSSKGSNGVESTAQYDVGCGEVNDTRWNHLNVRYSQTRTAIDATTGEISQVTTERGCYGPHGADYVDTCVVGAGCWVDYWIPGTNTAMRSAYGKCIAP